MPKSVIPLFVGILLSSFACQNTSREHTLPKPRMYPKVVFPSSTYEKVEFEHCDFTFYKLQEAVVEQKTKFFDTSVEEKCWFDLYYPDWNARVHYTFYEIENAEEYQTLVGESFKLAYEHTAMAASIKENPIIKEGKPIGFSFQLAGPVASPYQFFISDSTDYFLRGSVYFKARPNPDSIAPMLAFLETNLDTFYNTFQWQ